MRLGKDKSIYPFVQVGQKVSHLLVRETAFEGRHHAAAGEYLALYHLIGCRYSAGQGGTAEETVQVWRRRLEAEVVIFMAVGAAHVVEMLPFCLLRGQCRFGAAAGCAEQRQAGSQRKQRFWRGKMRHCSHSRPLPSIGSRQRAVPRIGLPAVLLPLADGFAICGIVAQSAACMVYGVSCPQSRNLVREEASRTFVPSIAPFAGLASPALRFAPVRDAGREA